MSPTRDEMQTLELISVVVDWCRRNPILEETDPTTRGVALLAVAASVIEQGGPGPVSKEHFAYRAEEAWELAKKLSAELLDVSAPPASGGDGGPSN